ncbi:MAG TPA: metalloregulator ArsR/SmtB family transcription factor [Usitatibacter sp.]|nr:metalloregulator ArsR/SmtB family transcription factor [Usitatibacter sp.]
MKTSNAVRQLGALAHDTRLAIFRALVQAGADGLTAGTLADSLGAPASTLSFHLKELGASGLVTSRPDGRFIHYAANFAAMNELLAYLTDKCCQVPAAPARGCAPRCSPVTSSKARNAR